MTRSRHADLVKLGQGDLLAWANAPRAVASEPSGPRTERRHPPAAVETDQSANVARVVPRRAKLMKVGGAVLGYVVKPQRTQRPFAFDQLRVAEVEKLIRHRHGPTGVDTDDGESYLEAVLPNLVALPKSIVGQDRVSMTPTAVLLGWTSRWTPRVEAPLASWDARAKAAGYRLKADTVARRLGVTFAERTELDLRTIGAVDMNKKDRIRLRREDARRRKQDARLAAGATPRERSLEQTQPWIQEGISRRTWFKRMKASKQAMCTVSSTIEKAALGPQRNGRCTVSSTIVGILPNQCGRISAPDLFAIPPSPARPDLLVEFDGGILPRPIIAALVDEKSRRGLTWDAVARRVGVSREQLANARSRRFGLSAGPALGVRAFLQEAA